MKQHFARHAWIEHAGKDIAPVGGEGNNIYVAVADKLFQIQHKVVSVNNIIFDINLGILLFKVFLDFRQFQLVQGILLFGIPCDMEDIILNIVVMKHSEHTINRNQIFLFKACSECNIFHIGKTPERRILWDSKNGDFRSFQDFRRYASD